MAPALYLPIYLTIVTILAYSYGLKYVFSNGFSLQVKKTNIFFPLIISIFFIFWIGGRPINGVYFGDTINYALSYSDVGITAESHISLSSEWIWFAFMIFCKNILGLDIHGFLTLVEAFYILSSLWAVKRFMPTNPMLGMLFVFTSLMFFYFGTNGLRKGLACHIILLALSFFFDDKYIIGLIICFIAFGIHRSTILPISGMIAGRYIIKDFRIAIYIWVLSIFVSLLAGDSILHFIGSLGFDDRLNQYNTSEYDTEFSQVGFRWDFLIYSFFPILMGWYVCTKKKIKDEWYQALCVTYCLCNAFWVIIIEAAFTNRFAYLSWFMYPVIIVYPLVNHAIWDDQDRKTGCILIAYTSFSVFMQGFYW